MGVLEMSLIYGKFFNKLMKTKFILFIFLIFGLITSESANAEYLKKIYFSNPNIESNCLKDKDIRICIELINRYQSQFNSLNRFNSVNCYKHPSMLEIRKCHNNYSSNYYYFDCINGLIYGNNKLTYKEFFYMKRNFCKT